MTSIEWVGMAVVVATLVLALIAAAGASAPRLTGKVDCVVRSLESAAQACPTPAAGAAVQRPTQVEGIADTGVAGGNRGRGKAPDDPPPRRPYGVWYVDADGRARPVDLATNPILTRLTNLYDAALDDLWTRYGLDGCDGKGSVPELLLAGVSGLLPNAPEPSVGVGISYVPPQDGLPPDLEAQLREAGKLGDLSLEQGILRTPIGNSHSEGVAHEIAHCVMDAHTARSVSQAGGEVSEAYVDPGLAEGMADIGAYNADAGTSVLRSFDEEGAFRRLYPEPLPQADEAACHADIHQRGQPLVAAYGQIVRALDPEPGPEYVNSQQLYLRVIQRHLTATTTMAGIRAAYLAAARELWPGPAGAGRQQAIERAFDAVGLVEGWTPPAC